MNLCECAPDHLIALLIGLPQELSRYAGVGLLPFAAFPVYLATRANLSQPALWVVIVLDLLWTVASILLLVSGWIEPKGLRAKKYRRTPTRNYVSILQEVLVLVQDLVETARSLESASLVPLGPRCGASRQRP